MVDPITATQKQELSAGVTVQAEARFGFSVAIDGNLAVVGAWREDIAGTPDQGAVYIFCPSNQLGFGKQGKSRLRPVVDSPQCGWSVAISGNGIVIGCPGINNSRGIAILIDTTGLAATPALQLNLS